MGKKNKTKAPKGRAAAKQKAKKGGAYSSPIARFSQPAFDGDDDFAPSFRGFAQRSAPSTPHRDFSTPSTKLRHQTIAFVSGGSNTPHLFQPKPAPVGTAADESDEDDDDSDDEDVLDENIETNILMYSDDAEISESAMANMNIHSSAETTGPETEHTSSDIEMVDTQTKPAADTPLFVVDTEGDPSLVAGWKSIGKRPQRRGQSPTPSDSSEEEVIFQGRQQPAKARPQSRTPMSNSHNSTPARSPHRAPSPQNAAKSSFPYSTDTPENVRPAQGQTPHVTDDLLRALERPSPSPQPQLAGSNPATAKGWGAVPSKLERDVNADATWAPAPAVPYWRKGKKRPDLDPSPEELPVTKAAPRSASKVAFAEPEAEQTIASLQADWKLIQREKQQARPSHAKDEIKLDFRAPTPKRRGKRGRKQDNRSLPKPVDDDDEDEDDDDDDEAAYDDYMANMAAQLDGADESGSAELLKSFIGGSSSLFVDGEEIGEDQVLKSHHVLMNEDDDDSDDSSNFSGLIGRDLDDMSSSDLEEELEYTEREQWEDEEDLRQRRRDQMTDEQIARTFAKQQEFGYHGDDIMFENGELFAEEDGVGDVASARAGLANLTNLNYQRSRGGGIRSRRSAGNDNFPDATAFADTLDQYGDNGFDIMDFDRPSLRPTKKGRKGRLPPEVEALSDDDLREALRDTWSNDRQKKSAKKAEREELRMQGLLTGSGKKGKPDLSVKYPFGISMEQIHDELRIFLLDDNMQNRPFPPMAKQDRKTLHEVANIFNLKSKSIGTGKDRYPSLFKTARTPTREDQIDRMLGLSIKGVFSRTARLGKKGVKKQATRGGKMGSGRGGAAPATVRNGEIVGANAPEISKDSFGHKMMEKMGWSKGMSLGKEGEGRLLPVEQMVRIGTMGLGSSTNRFG